MTFQTEHEVYGQDIEEIAYIFEKHTELYAFYGVPIEIEVWLDGNWYQVPLERGIDDVGIILNEKRGGVFAWDLEGYSLPEGRYRVIKKVDVTQSKLMKERLYAAEFSIGVSPYTKETPYGYAPLETLPEVYTRELARKNKDVIFTEDGAVEGDENIVEFFDKVELGIPTLLRTTRFLKNGDVMITDVEYTGAEDRRTRFLYTIDKTRAGGERTTTAYPYVITDGKTVYLSNWAHWAYKVFYQGEAGALLFEAEQGVGGAYGVQKAQTLSDHNRKGSVTEYKLLGEKYDFYFYREDVARYLERKYKYQAVVVTHGTWLGEGKFLISYTAEGGVYASVVYDMTTEEF